MKNINKHLSEEELAIYAHLLKEKKVEQAKPETKEHIANCNQCATEAIELSFVLDQVMINTEQSKKAKKLQINFLYWAVAASILLGLFVWFSPSIWQDKVIEQSAQEMKKKKNDTVQTKKEAVKFENTQIIPKEKDFSFQKNSKELLAYQTNKDLELLYEDFKGNMRGEEIKINTKNEITVASGKAILLQWQNTESVPLTIELFDHKGSNILSEETTKNSYKIEKNIKPALYYWKLYNEEFDLLFCGKIIVK